MAEIVYVTFQLICALVIVRLVEAQGVASLSTSVSSGADLASTNVTLTCEYVNGSSEVVTLVTFLRKRLNELTFSSIVSSKFPESVNFGVVPKWYDVQLSTRATISVPSLTMAATPKGTILVEGLLCSDEGAYQCMFNYTLSAANDTAISTSKSPDHTCGSPRTESCCSIFAILSLITLIGLMKDW